MRSYPLNVDKKTGFRVTNPSVPILIVDERGIPFYDTSKIENRVHQFNLPQGKYMVLSGRFTPQYSPVEYGLVPLPEPERKSKPNPEHFKIKVGAIPQRCIIDWQAKEIVYDHAMTNLPLPALMFIYYHECGHRYYFTELYCDNYASNKMLEAGYNPSQIGEASIGSLSSRQDYRKQETHDHMIDAFDGVEGIGDSDITYKSIPLKSWSVLDWSLWYNELVIAYSSGKIGSDFDYHNALEKANMIFAYWWRKVSPMALTTWGEQGWTEQANTIFSNLGFTDHISFINAINEMYDVDGFDWSSVGNWFSRTIGYATGNPVLVMSADVADQTSDIIEEATGEDVPVYANDVAPEGSGVDFGGFIARLLQPLAVILVLLIVVLLLTRE